MDKATANELLEFILQSLGYIKDRFQSIKSSNDFLAIPNGVEKLDSIAMRLQSIGEAIKNLDKREPEFLLKVADSNYWSKIIRTREIISHHYIGLDEEIIYMICDTQIQELAANIQKIKDSLNNE